ncbi:hypothetical protein EIP86_010444 [Pleurotus ostreatoroseus]|nr:hypothetical protein EIP86_010444 [Pleurotus ostreatoroseus]
MPSFLNKVFGRKKDDKPGSPTAHAHKRHSNASLLEGKYEAVSPNVSPSATKFTETAQQAKDKDGASSNPLSLFRSRSRNITDPTRSSSTPSLPTPQLTLNLPVPKEEKSRALGVVFEADPDNISTLPEAVIGERRLSPLEALLLVKACSEYITRHGGESSCIVDNSRISPTIRFKRAGYTTYTSSLRALVVYGECLETLGLMHPHWYAASPEVQRKLISLYILSLDSKIRSPVSTLSPTPISPSTLFSTELEYTRSPHDVAAVLRWAIRHVRLEGSSFGSKGQGEWEWFADFATREREGGWSPSAFSQILVPQLPPAHVQLLTATLDIIESLAAHAETTGTSGSKLAKMFGYWLLAQPRTKSSDDWMELNKRFRTAGRILEHLFLAHVREEALTNRIPLRLADLIKQYPYDTRPPREGQLPLLEDSVFATRPIDTIYVQIDTELPSPNSKRPSYEHPLRMIREALKAAPGPDSTIHAEADYYFQRLKKAIADESENNDSWPVLSKVLDDETLRILSLVPAETSDVPTSPVSTSTASTVTPILRTPIPRRRSSSAGAATGASSGKTATNGHTRDSTAPAAFTNWSDFSVVGFGDSLLTKDFATTLDTDTEVTSPPVAPALPSKKRAAIAGAGRGRASTVDTSSLQVAAEKRGREGAPTETPRKVVLKRVIGLNVDEAFVDFWRDSISDPISSSWPSLAVFQLRSGVWDASLLVIEHSYTAPKPPPPPPVPAIPPVPERRAASPRPGSFASNVSGNARKSFTFSPNMKRFSLFSSHNESSTKTAPRKGSRSSMPKSPRIGEMGEILPEEPSSSSPPPVPPLPTKERESALPPVPVVSASPIDTSAPVHVEPTRTDDTSKEKPTVDIPKDLPVPTDTTTMEEKALPPAPERVVLTGNTPSPQVALASSEPAAIVQASTLVDADVAADSQPKAEDQSGQLGLPHISNLSELATSAPVDPPPESPTHEDAPADAPPAAPTSHGSRLIETFSESQASSEPENSPSHTEVSQQEPAKESASEDKDEETAADDAVPSSSSAQPTIPVQEVSNPTSYNSEDTVVGSDPGPADDAEPSSQPEAPIDEIRDTQPEDISSAPATEHSSNGAISQEPIVPAATTANPDTEIKAETSTSSNVDYNQTDSL